MCERCRGVGFIMLDVPMRHPDFGKPITCSCQAEKRKAATQRKLEALDGLTNVERSHRFETTVPTAAQTAVRDTLRHAFTGIYVLEGTPGNGKSHFMHCVVNQAREQGRVAVYAAMPDILDYLRAAFNPKNEEPFEERWKLLISCEVLAIDELDEFNATEWAKERFLRLIDERWRNRDTLLTVVAMNGDARSLIPKVASRLTQGRVLRMNAPDMRPLFRDEAVYA